MPDPLMPHPKASKDLYATSSVSSSVAHVMRRSGKNRIVACRGVTSLWGGQEPRLQPLLCRAYCCGIGNALSDLSISVSTSMPGGNGPSGQLLQMHTFWGRQPAPVGRDDWPRGSINGMDPSTAHMEREKYRCIAICQLNCHIDRNPASHGRLNFLLLMRWFQTCFAPPLWSSRQLVFYTLSQHHGAYHLSILRPEHSDGVDTHEESGHHVIHLIHKMDSIRRFDLTISLWWAVPKFGLLPKSLECIAHHLTQCQCGSLALLELVTQNR